MKIVLLFLLALFNFSCNEINQAKRQEYATIKYMDFNSTTTVAVPCENLEQMTDDSIVIKLKPYLDSLKGFVKEFENTDLPDINCRGKISFYFDGLTGEYCFDKFGHFNKGGHYYTNPSLFNFIKRKIKQ